MKGQIYNWNEAEDLNRFRLPEIGRLKVGVPTNKDKYFHSIDYFRPAGRDGGPCRFADFFHQTFGERPQTIPITFLDDDPSHVCNEHFLLKKGPSRWAYGDGRLFMVYSLERKQYIPYIAESEEQARIWMIEQQKQVGEKWDRCVVLRFAIPKIGLRGEWIYTTTAKTHIDNIVPPFNTAVEISKQMGTTIVGKPFELNVYMHKSWTPAEDGKQKNKYPIVSLSPGHSSSGWESRLISGPDQEVIDPDPPEDVPIININ